MLGYIKKFFSKQFRVRRMEYGSIGRKHMYIPEWKYMFSGWRMIENNRFTRWQDMVELSGRYYYAFETKAEAEAFLVRVFDVNIRKQKISRILC